MVRRKKEDKPEEEKSEAIPVETLPLTMEQTADLGLDTKFEGTADENFDKLLGMITDFKNRIGFSVIEGRWAIGKLVQKFDLDKDKKLFGEHRFKEVVDHTLMRGETLNHCKKLAETWTLDEVRNWMHQGISSSHFERIAALATVEERRQAVEKCVGEGGTLTVRQLDTMLPSSKQSKLAAGKKPGAGRPSKQDKAVAEKKTREKSTDPGAAGLDDPYNYICRIDELAQEVKKLMMGAAKMIRVGEESYEDDRKKLLRKGVKQMQTHLEQLNSGIVKFLGLDEEDEKPEGIPVKEEGGK